MDCLNFTSFGNALFKFANLNSARRKDTEKVLWYGDEFDLLNSCIANIITYGSWQNYNL